MSRQPSFEELLNIPIRDEKGYFQYVKALYEEWRDRRNSGYPTLKRLNRRMDKLSAEIPPQFFTGNIHSPVVIISLNPHADRNGGNTEITAADYCQSWEDYRDFWTRFPEHRYAENGMARREDGRLSNFDRKLHRFLSRNAAEVTSNELARWNLFHLELFPIASPGFNNTRNMDDILFPFVLRSLEAVSLYERDLILFLNRQLGDIIRRMARNDCLEIKGEKVSKIEVKNRKSRCFRREFHVKLSNGACMKIIGAPTFAAQGFDGSSLAEYGMKFFAENERKAIRKSLGIEDK